MEVLVDAAILSKFRSCSGGVGMMGRSKMLTTVDTLESKYI